MKVIAKASESKYLCEVSHEELEKFMNQYYGKMSKLSVGQDLNLGQGYDFAARIEAACKSMADAMKEFGRSQQVMTAYAMAVAGRSQEGGAA